MENLKQESPEFIDAVGQRLLGRTSSSAVADSPLRVPFVLFPNFFIFPMSTQIGVKLTFFTLEVII